MDFGCGQAKILKKIYENYKSSNLYGVDVFQSDDKLHYANLNCPVANIEKIDPYQDIPFDLKFDIVIANQVFEHIENKKLIFKQIYNCLSDKGLLIAGFPTKEIIIEPHLKLPFIHYFPKSSSLQRLYLKIAYIINLGCFNRKKKLNNSELFINTLDYINNCIFYKKYRWYQKNLRDFFPFIYNLNYKDLCSLREKGVLNNLVKIIFSKIKLEIVSQFFARKVFGVFLICSKESLTTNCLSSK